MSHENFLLAVANDASASGRIAGMVTLATAVIGLVATVVKLLLKLNFERARTVSTGLAIGYYYNFLHPIFEQLKAYGELEISLKEKESALEERRKVFKKDHLEIEIIVPAALTEIGMEDARRQAEGLRNGIIIFKDDAQRQFIVKFLIAENRLIIRDVATPLNAVREYLENLDAFKTTFKESGARRDGVISAKFHARQKQETENFIETVKFYINKERHTDKKYCFKNP